MKVPTRRWGNVGWKRLPIRALPASMKVPTRRWGNVRPRPGVGYQRCLNESPHPKVGKFLGFSPSPFNAPASMKVPTRRWGNSSDLTLSVTPIVASMKVPTRRWGNSHPKLTRNYAAETGALREPRSRPTQKVYPSSRLSIQTLLTSQNITRATHQDYVTCQVLAETDKASKGHYPHLPTSPQSNSSFLRSPAARR